MCTYLTYTGAGYHARSVSREVPADVVPKPKQPDSSTLNSVVFEALLPFPEAAAAVLALLNKRLGTEVPI
jgi:hypothetical protein